MWAEKQYIYALGDLLRSGEPHEDRTGVGTNCLFGTQIKTHLRAGFPLLTTKKVSLKQTFNELKWFLSGSTNAYDLPEETQKFWTPWADEDGELGPTYGEALRYYNYQFDQLEELYRQLHDEPNSRRLVMTTWQADVLDQMHLPPCHGLVIQFKCHSDRTLSLHMYQRSADWFIGVPYNLASYALLLELVATTVGRQARELVMSFGDYHLYRNHFDAASEQLKRRIASPPTLRVSDRLWKGGMDALLDAKFEDLELKYYLPQAAIKAPVAV